MEEQLGRIRDLARRLGFNDAKTKMLIGQSARDLVGLERKLLNELDDHPETKSAGNVVNGHRAQQKDASHTSGAATSKTPDRVPAGGPALLDVEFLF
jgi:hypothetical protein